MASFRKYETKKGTRWMFELYGQKDPMTGKPERITRRGFKLEREAKAAAKQYLEELEYGKVVNANKTFRDVAEEVLELQEKTCKPSTMKSKRSKFNSRLYPAFGKLKIDEITQAYCQKFIDNLEKELDAARDYGIQLNLVFKHAMRQRYITQNPMQFIVYTQTREGEEDDDKYDGYWSKEESLHFLSIAENNTSFSNYVLFRLAIFTGMRKGEILALRERDLLHDTKEIRVQRTLYWNKQEWQLLTPKTKMSKRHIPVDEETWLLLKRLITSNNAQRLAAGKMDDKDKFLFIRSEFQPLRMGYPNEVLTAMCKRFKLKWIKFHGLRHTYASMLFASGARMKDVQVLLGHARLETTMNIYTHITQESKDNVHANFMDFMTKKEPQNQQEELAPSKQRQKLDSY